MVSEHTGREIVDVIEGGLDLYTADGEKLGHIDEINPDFLLLSEGLLFQREMYVPRQYVDRTEEDKVYLTLSRDQIEGMDWSQAPTAGSATADIQTEQVAYEQPVVEHQATQVDSGAQRIQLHEEELQAQKTAAEVGEVRITKDVVEEQQTLNVPVTREEVQIQRRVVDRPAEASTDAFQESTIEVPIREEQVQVSKQARVVEELEIGKTAVQETQTVTDTVRREEVRVEEEGDTQLRSS